MTLCHYAGYDMIYCNGMIVTCDDMISCNCVVVTCDDMMSCNVTMVALRRYDSLYQYDVDFMRI